MSHVNRQMGGGESADGTYLHDTIKIPKNEPKNYMRMEMNVPNLMDDDSDDELGVSSLQQFNVNKTEFYAVWSIYRCNGDVPMPRIGHFTAYFEKLHTCFMGYGKVGKNKFANDVWAINIDNRKWSKLKLYGDYIEPRNNSIATVMDNYIVVFGGEFENNENCSDLHTIDITTGEVIIAKTHGCKPPPRNGGCIAIFQNQLFIWGGECYSNQNNLYVMSFNKMKWKSYPCNAEYHNGSSYIVKGKYVFIYGASEKNDFTIIDMKNYTITNVQTYPPYPPPFAINGGMFLIGNTIFYISGYSENYWSFLYGYNIETKKWNLINLCPDGETTSVSDGRINIYGNFSLPTIHSFSTIYVEHKKEIHFYLGYPLQSRRFSCIDIKNVLSYFNMKTDMLQILYL